MDPNTATVLTYTVSTFLRTWPELVVAFLSSFSYENQERLVGGEKMTMGRERHGIFFLFVYSFFLCAFVYYSTTEHEQEVQQRMYHLQLSRLDILILLSIFEDHRHKNKFYFLFSIL